MIKDILDSVREDYKIPKSGWIIDTVTEDDVAALRKQSEEVSAWDVAQLRLTEWKSLQAGKGFIKAFVSPFGGRVVILGKNVEPPPNSWIRIFRLLNKDKPIKVLWFLSKEERIAPPIGNPIEACHINGGFTMRCDATSVVIYRKEEATRVLIHELLHASCTDVQTSHVEEIEADTEAWAEVVLAAICAKGEPKVFENLWGFQSQYAVNQAAAMEKYHNVCGPSDYAWRYITGRLKYFKSFGLLLPPPSKYIKPMKSLRLTLEKLEPQDI